MQSSNIADVIRGNVFLIGPMGAGKTTIGRQLARRLGREFFDSDREIERSAGVDIATIFEFEGEPGFRKRETRIIKELTAKQEIVMATGGGVVLDAENRRSLTANGSVVYLNTSVEEQLKRTRRDKGRPLLHTEDPRQVLLDLAAVRNPLYESIADLQIYTEGRKARNVINQLIKELQTL